MKHPRSRGSKVMRVLSWKGKDISKGFSVFAHFPKCLIMVLDYEQPLEPVSQLVPLGRNRSGEIGSQRSPASSVRGGDARRWRWSLGKDGGRLEFMDASLCEGYVF